MCIQKSHEQDEEEDEDLDERRHPDFSYYDGPGIHKYELNIEDEKDQRVQIVADVELIPGSSRGGDTAFVGLPFLCVLPAFDEEAGDGDASRRKRDPGEE